MRKRTLLIPIILAISLTACKTVPDPAICPMKRPATDAAKENLFDCCTVFDGKERIILPQYTPLFAWLRDITILNAELDACRGG
jgi:hypothetical protein